MLTSHKYITFTNNVSSKTHFPLSHFHATITSSTPRKEPHHVQKEKQRLCDKAQPQGPKMRFKSEKEAQEYLAKLKEKNNKYRK